MRRTEEEIDRRGRGYWEEKRIGRKGKEEDRRTEDGREGVEQRIGKRRREKEGIEEKGKEGIEE